MGVLDGQVALVTGCGRMDGLGRTIARTLAEQGADVAVTDIKASGTRNIIDDDKNERDAGWKGLDSTVEEIQGLGRRSVGLIGDVGEKADAENMVNQTVSQLGRLDILVNNAGAPHGADRNWTWEVPEEAFDLVMKVNTKGIFLMASAAARHMLERGGPGRIVNIASEAGRMGIPMRAAYCASKFAVVGLTQVLALELASHGITVNVVCPGSIDTPRSRSTAARVAKGEDAGVAPNIPIGRIGKPEDIAAAVAYFASPAASFVTGQSIGVNGGQLPR